ncbi:unnamed protein product [Spirodela intermedia]|uniref:Uncharacterized protein n=2 Tax=Spirodela intermedia TaxID=51605 RepID=A0A7I8KB14_SPIIN|nr:unnamed protein product [Spirodela intermedia]CAA6658130.1 unnamed protein product [Spirodela intermedia]CAA7394288.1 unnamed protein product [Spirodela intermedia]
MDAMQMVIPVLGIAAAAAVTFYAVSFSEIRERSFAELEESEDRGGGFRSTASSRQTRARRKAEKEARKREP